MYSDAVLWLTTSAVSRGYARCMGVVGHAQHSCIQYDEREPSQRIFPQAEHAELYKPSGNITYVSTKNS